LAVSADFVAGKEVLGDDFLTRELRGFEIVQSQFARELGISQGQLSRYEKGRSEIGAEILLRLARRTGKTVEWLLTGKDGV
jgi:transcriptional regulator with XRE-family HTH domain